MASNSAKWLKESLVINSFPDALDSGVADSRIGGRRGCEVFARFGSQRLPNLRIGLIELAVAPELTFLGPTDALFGKPDRSLGQQFLTVDGTVVSALLVFSDVAADKPITKRQADIDSTPGLSFAAGEGTSLADQWIPARWLQRDVVDLEGATQ
jgi:hypothetical protein